MDLDNTKWIKEQDSQDMLGHIEGLPNQLEAAWKLGEKYAGALERMEIRQVVVAGMGGSAIGAALASAYAAPAAKAPVFVLRDYDLPAWVEGKHTLLVGSSHSGNTEETLSAFWQGQERGCTLLALTKGGKLAEVAGRAGAPVWSFEHEGQPRAAVGYSFGLLLAALVHYDLLPDPSEDIAKAAKAMRAQQEELSPGIPAVENPAKRIAGQLMGRWITVFGAGVLAPVARRWKGQFNELAKAWAAFEALPEADHNTLAGLFHPDELLMRSVAIFLTCPSDHPRNQLRSNLTRQALMLEGISTELLMARGESPLENQWTAIHLGDYLAFYLSVAYGMDPTPIPPIDDFKEQIRPADQDG